MKKLTFHFAILLMIPFLLLSGCKKENEETFDGQKILADYLVAQNLDLNTILNGFVVDARTSGDVSAFYLIDIRTAAEFAQGHIAGANRVDFVNILDEAAKATKPILVICKSGQTATYASTLLRLSGYTDAKSLKWGMSGWNSELDIWTGNIGNIADGHANWTTATAPTNLTYSSPKLSVTDTDPENILETRVAAVIAEGFKSVTPSDVLNNPGNYFINNYFPETDYLNFGHINGAFRINPMLVGEAQVNFLNPNKRIVTYCYTGQTSGAITAYLRVLGYDAVSMLWGMNGLHNASTSWASNKWSASMSLSNAITTN
jgi:rhodanese-related sulfurtransferase